MSTYADYAAIPAVNWTTLKEMRISPLNYAHHEQQGREDSDTLTNGRAAHMAVFEPERFEAECVVWTGAKRRGKKWESFKAENQGKTILLPSAHEQCCSLRDAVRNHPLSGPILRETGKAEQSVTWTDEETGLPCKARIDFVSEIHHVEYKTAATIDQRLFGRQAVELGYHGQLAMQHAGLCAHGIDLPVVLIAVEKTAPHDVMVWEPSEEELWVGDWLWHDLLGRVKACRESGVWPGRYSEPVHDILPPWEFPDDTESEYEIMGLVPSKEHAR